MSINTTSQALVAQLDRASDYGSEGCEFEPRRVRHFFKLQLWSFFYAQNLKKIRGENSQEWVRLQKRGERKCAGKLSLRAPVRMSFSEIQPRKVAPFFLSSRYGVFFMLKPTKQLIKFSNYNNIDIFSKNKKTPKIGSF